MRAPRISPKDLDLSAFEAWLRGQLAGAAFAAVVAVVLQVIRALFAQNLQLRARIAGRSARPPSERLARVERQLSFGFALPTNDVAPAVAAAADPATKDPPRERPPRPKPRPRTKIGAGLPIEDVPNDIPAGERLCERCGVTMATVTHRKTYRIERIPERLVLQVLHGEVVACPCCDAIRRAPALPSVGDGGTLGPKLVTEALASKVLDAMPIERQARNLQRQGAPVAASTLGRAVSSVLALMVPLADRVARRVRASTHVQLDATTLPVLDHAAPEGIVRHTLWTLLGDGRWIYFAPLPTGDADAIEAVIADAEAESFQCDGTSTTNFIEKKLQKRRPGCHAHARRRLVEAARRGDLRALEGLRLYTTLFAIERRADRAKLDPAARQRIREAESLPVLDALRAWVLALAPTVEPKSMLGEALGYLQRQWLRLCHFVFDGAVEVTNNASERALRPWALGRHAWLFMGDAVHATRWAAAYTLCATALAQGLNPRAYLHAIVTELIAGHPHTRLDELLPDAMRVADPTLVLAARGGRAGDVVKGDEVSRAA
ncbi:MAG: IS66 family transposase [Polyangiaceae bacterium]|nr:IS66 family transposase [Polyangiaceae bacterium]